MNAAFAFSHSRTRCGQRRVAFRPALHPREQRRERFLRVDERDPFEELALVEQALELVAVVLAEPAPEDEELRRRDTRGRVELQAAEPPDRVEHARGAAVEGLGADRDAARLGERDLLHVRRR